MTDGGPHNLFESMYRAQIKAEEQVQRHWEYYVCYIHPVFLTAQNELDALGADGWQLVAVDNGIAFLMRPGASQGVKTIEQSVSTGTGRDGEPGTSGA